MPLPWQVSPDCLVQLFAGETIQVRRPYPHSGRGIALQEATDCLISLGIAFAVTEVARVSLGRNRALADIQED